MSFWYALNFISLIVISLQNKTLCNNKSYSIFRFFAFYFKLIRIAPFICLIYEYISNSSLVYVLVSYDLVFLDSHVPLNQISDTISYFYVH